MSSKMGRPVVGNPKTNDIKVRVDDVTHQKLLDYCQTEKITKAEAIRKAIETLLEIEK